MSLIRLILFGLLIYFAFKMINHFLNPPHKRTEIKGNRRGKPPLDLTNKDVEDADYEDLD